MANTEDTEEFYCAAQTYAQTLETPAEYCENEVDNDGDYCSEHRDDDGYEEPDDFDDYRHGMGRYAEDYWLDD